MITLRSSSRKKNSKRQSNKFKAVEDKNVDGDRNVFILVKDEVLPFQIKMKKPVSQVVICFNYTLSKIAAQMHRCTRSCYKKHMNSELPTCRYQLL
jgi:hypothetical protein